MSPGMFCNRVVFVEVKVLELLVAVEDGKSDEQQESSSSRPNKNTTFMMKASRLSPMNVLVESVMEETRRIFASSQ